MHTAARAGFAFALAVTKHVDSVPTLVASLKRHAAEDEFAGALCASLALSGDPRGGKAIRETAVAWAVVPAAAEVIDPWIAH